MGPQFFWSSGMWIFPTIGLIILSIGALVAICMIFNRRGFSPPFRSPMSHNRRTTSDTSLEILKKRYARGEITKEEFDQMREDLLYGFWTEE